MLPKMELCKSWNPQKHLYKWGYHKIHLEIKMHTPKDLPPENHKWRFLSRGWAKDTQPAMFIYCHVRLLGLLKQFPYCWWFRNSKANYLTCMKRLKSRDIYHINWRRISSINSIATRDSCFQIFNQTESWLEALFDNALPRDPEETLFEVNWDGGRAAVDGEALTSRVLTNSCQNAFDIWNALLQLQFRRGIELCIFLSK